MPDLRELSDRAGYDEPWGVRQFGDPDELVILSGNHLVESVYGEDARAKAEFIVALVNAFRSGELERQLRDEIAADIEALKVPTAGLEQDEGFIRASHALRRDTLMSDPGVRVEAIRADLARRVKIVADDRSISLPSVVHDVLDTYEDLDRPLTAELESVRAALTTAQTERDQAVEQAETFSMEIDSLRGHLTECGNRRIKERAALARVEKRCADWEQILGAEQTLTVSSVCVMLRAVMAGGTDDRDENGLARHALAGVGDPEATNG